MNLNKISIQQTLISSLKNLEWETQKIQILINNFIEINTNNNNNDY